MRKKAFRRNPALEVLLQELNGLLEPVGQKITRRYHHPEFPVVLVVGAPRSGSTLMMQWLASTGKFAYPTNLLSRFYMAPYIGARVQQLLMDPRYSFRDELSDLQSEITFTSELGKTHGALAPNEFWYFWRRFFPHQEPRFVSEDELREVKGAQFLAEIASLEAVFGKPWAMKALILALNLDFLAGLFERVLFLYLKRKPYYNIQSLLEAREEFFGTRSGWYSIKPSEYSWLKDLDPVEQVAGQVFYTNQAISKALGQIHPSRRLAVSYEQFCEDPGYVFHRIVEKFSEQGFSVDWIYSGVEQFPAQNHLRLLDEVERISEAYARFSGEAIQL